MTIAIDAVLTGKARAFCGGEASAIDKLPFTGARAVSRLGIAGDEQADLTVHGGIDKAIHHYPRDHYGWWAETLGGHILLTAPGAFGENISTRGLIEGTVCIGDRYRLGSALVEISQGRQPCWKIDHHFGVKGMLAAVIQTGRSGYYFRVIEEGLISADDGIEQVERPRHGWTVERVFQLLIGGMHRIDGAKAALRELADMEVLAVNWRGRARQLLESLPD